VEDLCLLVVNIIFWKCLLKKAGMHLCP
jgi:hypothetical protein